VVLASASMEDLQTTGAMSIYSSMEVLRIGSSAADVGLNSNADYGDRCAPMRAGAMSRITVSTIGRTIATKRVCFWISARGAAGGQTDRRQHQCSPGELQTRRHGSARNWVRSAAKDQPRDHLLRGLRHPGRSVRSLCRGPTVLGNQGSPIHVSANLATDTARVAEVDAWREADRELAGFHTAGRFEEHAA